MSPTVLRRSAALIACLTAMVVLTAASEASGGKPQAQRFTLTSTTIHGVDKPIHVIAAGPINGNGTVSAPKRASRHDHLTLHFRHGAVLIDVRETFVAVHPNYRACTVRIVGRGTFTITGGSGSFRGARGAGTFSRHSKMIGERTPSGTCIANVPPKAVYTTSTLIGKSTLAAR